MFIEALFMIDKNRKKSKCPSMDAVMIGLSQAEY